MQEWIRIEDFPDYEVSYTGEIRHWWTKKPLKASFTREGAVKINLRRDSMTHTRSVPKIVALAHLWNDRDPEKFDTPIHLDNDLSNNHVDNLAWRPRWFAVKYQRQYWQEQFRFNTIKVMDLDTGIRYEGLMGPCQEFGLYYVDVLNSCNRGESVFPLRKIFAYW